MENPHKICKDCGYARYLLEKIEGCVLELEHEIRQNKCSSYMHNAYNTVNTHYPWIHGLVNGKR